MHVFLNQIYCSGPKRAFIYTHHLHVHCVRLFGLSTIWFLLNKKNTCPQIILIIFLEVLIGEVRTKKAVLMKVSFNFSKPWRGDEGEEVIEDNGSSYTSK